jgi:hypothetical protein
MVINIIQVLVGFEVLIVVTMKSVIKCDTMQFGRSVLVFQ